MATVNDTKKKKIRTRTKKREDKTELQIKAIEAAARASQKMREREKRIERIAIAGIFSFLGIIGIWGWYSNGKLVADTVTFLQSFEGDDARPSASVVLNCQHPKNRNTAYCLEREREQQATWREITRFGGKGNAFPLYRKER